MPRGGRDGVDRWCDRDPAYPPPVGVGGMSELPPASVRNQVYSPWGARGDLGKGGVIEPYIESVAMNTVWWVWDEDDLTDDEWQVLCMMGVLQFMEA